MNKRKLLCLAISTSFLFSCNGNSNENLNEIDAFLVGAKKGFIAETASKQHVLKKNSDEEMYVNLYNYDYTFSNFDRAKTVQQITYTQNGVENTSSIKVARSDDGYCANEYINYKNEISYSPIADSDGNYNLYDKYYSNPFLYVEARDFTLVKEDGNTHIYSFNKDKYALLNYFMIGSNIILNDVTFTFVDNEISRVDSTSTKTGVTAYDYDLKQYVKGDVYYTQYTRISNVGIDKVDPIEVSEKNENHDEISTVLNKVNDNFTMDFSLIYNEATLLAKKTSYFDGTAYYYDSDTTKDDLTEDYIFKKDVFAQDDKLYQYSYNSDSSSWVETSIDSTTSYNVSPRGKEYFIPHLNEVSPNLFIKEDGIYKINNKYAVAFVGNGFLSDCESSSFFALGYGLDCSFTYSETNNELDINIPFYYYMDSTYLLLTANIHYRNIGSTSLPIEY